MPNLPFQMMEEEVIGNSCDNTLFGDDKNCQGKDEYHSLLTQLG